jgi:SAM-dependent methyltransferase
MRGVAQHVLDFLTFPLRAFTLFHQDGWGLSCLATERYDYVAREVRGHCLDVGCGRHNRFVSEFLDGNGVGIDVFPYEGLKPEQVVADLDHFPFADGTFASVAFIANINHVPEPNRDAELAEAYRCLMPGGNIIITMGNPVAEYLVHQVVWLYDRMFGTNVDMDTERGMALDEAYYLSDGEIRARLTRAGFAKVRKKYFWTQWGLNHLFVAIKAGEKGREMSATPRRSRPAA